MLTPEQKASLRQQLIEEKTRLRGEVVTLAQGASEKADCSIADPADAAALQERRHRAASLRAHHELTLSEIDAALLRLENGRYGMSESTGEPIPYERLAIMPWART